MVSTYISAFDYRRSATGLETDSLIGNLSRLSGTHALGATTLNLTKPLIKELNAYDQVTIFDGPSSEVVIVAAFAAIGATGLTIQSGLTYAHASDTPWCSDGSGGSLADEIVAASAWLENICQQSLWLASYANETLKIPSMRAAFDNENQLVFRPRHFPVVADSGIVIKASNTAPITYDASQIILDGAQQIVSVPSLVSSGSNIPNVLLPQASRTQNLWLQISYTAGFTAIPADAKDACIMLCSDILSRTQNPTGAAEIQLGKKHLIQTMRGDVSGEGALVKRAKQILDASYSVDAI